MPVVARERTISFYEVVQIQNLDAVRVDQFEWQSLLSAVEAAPLDDRTWDGDYTYVGSVLNFDGVFRELEVPRHLLLHRVKDPGEWLSRLDRRTGVVEDLESGQAQGYLETSAVCFLPEGNLVGMVQGSTSAPSHVAVGHWLNGIQAFGEQKVALRPVVAQAEIERLATASGASRVEIRIGQSKAANLKDKGGRLAKTLRRAQADYGHGVRVTMVISVPRGKGYDEQRSALLQDLTELQDFMPESAEIARARLVYGEDGPQETRRMVEFVEHRITAKARISGVDQDGETIRVVSAVSAILAQATLHADELLLAVDVSE